MSRRPIFKDPGLVHWKKYNKFLENVGLQHLPLVHYCANHVISIISFYPQHDEVVPIFIFFVLQIKRELDNEIYF